MAKVDRSILSANDQNMGDFGDPNKLENSIAHLANTIDGNDTDISTLQTDNTSNKGRLNTLETDVSTLKSDNTGNKSKITTLEGDNATNKNRLGVLETDNASNKNRISTNESNIAYNEGRLVDLLRDNQKASEVVDARMGFPVLRDKLENVDAQLAERTSQQTLVIKDSLTNSEFQTLINEMVEGDTLIIDTVLDVSEIKILNKKNITIRANSKKYGFNAIGLPVQVINGVKSSFYLNGCEGVVIDNLNFTWNALDAIIIGLENCDKCEIKNNSLTNTASATATGIYSIGGTDNKFNSNRIDACGRGIWVGVASTGLMETNPEIAGNKISNNKASAIAIASKGGKISLNFCDGNQGSGVAVSSNTGQECEDVEIIGNTFKNHLFHGVQSDAMNGSVTKNIKVIGNTCDNNTSSGIYTAHSFGWVILGNICKNNKVNGVEVYDSENAVISNNTCFDDRTGAGRTQKKGIYLNPATKNNKKITVSSNIITNHIEQGIFLTQGTYFSEDCVINGNTIHSNDVGIYVHSLNSRITVVNNNVKNNVSYDVYLRALEVIDDGNSIGAYYDGYTTVFYTFPASDTTPSVKGGRRRFRFNNSAATSVTTFDDGYLGQEIVVWFANANTTMVSGTLTLKGNVNVTPPTNAFMSFVNYGGWHEVSRSF